MYVMRYLLALALSLALVGLAQTQDRQEPRTIEIEVDGILLKLAVQDKQDKDKQDKKEDKKGDKKDNVLEVGDKGVNIDSKLDGNDGAYGDKTHSKVFLVKLVKDKNYRIDMRSDDFDAYLYLEDAKKNLLAEDDDSGKGNTGLDARIMFKAPADGVYRIITTSFEGDSQGNFKLIVVDRDAGKDKKEPGKKDAALEIGKKPLVIDSKLDQNDAAYGDNKLHAKLYLVKLVKGKTYQFDMSSDDLDSYLYLEDPGKKLVAEDDDSGGGNSGLDSQFVFTAKEDGVHRLIVTSFGGDETGAFRLTIVEN